MCKAVMQLFRDGGTYRQKVTRPAGSLVLEPTELFGGLLPTTDISLEMVERAMSTHVPKVLATNLPEASDGESRRSKAGVLIPVFEETGSAHLILTRRSSSLRNHAGEIAFPGGKVEPGESVESAALRETWEEIGLAPEKMSLLGQLLSASTSSSSFNLVAFVATTAKPDSYIIDRDEVDEVFSLPISHLCKESVYSVESWPTRNGEWRNMHFFDLGDDLIWGATARILFEFLMVIERSIKQ